VTGITPIVAAQLAGVRETFPDAEAAVMPDGTVLLTVPELQLPAGWSQSATHVMFVVPVGYPMARPDCFFADASLRLANGGMPMNTGMQPLPPGGVPHLWFSWHLAAWNPTTDTLMTYIRVIRDRFNHAR
jgi:hypothetical protein